jgi:hypothetical protein
MYVNKTKTNVNVTENMYMMTCTESLEHAYVYSDKFYKMSWLKHSPATDEDMTRVAHVNNIVKQQVPTAVDLDTYIVGRVNNTLTEIYLGPNIMLIPEDRLTLTPQHLFIQRLTPQTKTFDIVVVNNDKATVISAVDKNDLHDIRQWYTSEIFCGGADPLPIKYIVKALKHQTYEAVCNALQVESDSDEEWVQTESESDTESESEDDLY